MDGITSVTPFPYDTYSSEDWASQLGLRGMGPDGDSLAGAPLEMNSANGRREYVLVKNRQGGTLVPGQALKFKSTYFGVGVEKSASGSSLAGFVPPAINGSISTTIPDGAYFWMVKEGFTSVLKSAGAVTEFAQVIASATAGQAGEAVGSTADYVGGTFIEANDGGSSLTRAYVNCQWL